MPDLELTTCIAMYEGWKSPIILSDGAVMELDEFKAHLILAAVLEPSLTE